MGPHERRGDEKKVLPEPQPGIQGEGGIFGWNSGTEAAQPAIDVKTLHAKIGELTLVNAFLAGALGKAGLLPSAEL